MSTSGFLCRGTHTALRREPGVKLLLHRRCCCRITVTPGILLPQNCGIAVPAATTLLSQSLCCCCYRFHVNKPRPAARLPPRHHPGCRGITAPLLLQTCDCSIPCCC